MSSEWELDEGIKSIKSAWRREHTARTNLEKMLEQAEAENAKLRMLVDLKQTCWKYVGWCSECPYNGLDDEHDDCNCTVREKVNSLARELGIEMN